MVPAQSSARNTVTVTNPGSQSSVAGTVVSLQIKASDSASGQTLAYTAAGLPPGLSVDSSTGLISGVIPSDVAASFPVTVTAQDTTGASGSAAFTWTLHNKVTVANPGPQRSSVDTAVSLQIEASSSGFRLTLAYTAAGLPPGLLINRSTGLISGTTSGTPGTFTVMVTAQDSSGASASAVFEWATIPKVTVTSPGSQDFATDAAVSLPIKASDSAGRPLSYTAVNLPPGLSINPSTGLISGTTPGRAGTFTVTVTARDTATSGASGSAAFTWNIRNQVIVTNPRTMASAIGTAVNLQIAAISGQPLTYSAAGLPPGVSINPATGLISGTTTGAQGVFPVTVTAQDPTGSSGSAVFDWIIVNKVTVADPGTRTSFTDIVVDVQIQASDSASGQTLTYTAAGLPPGLSINPSTGLISGTTSAPGDFFAVTVTARDSTGASGSAAFTWTVRNLVTVTNPGTQTSATGTPVNVPIHASDSASGQTLTYTAVNLPSGLSINRSTGLISGTIPASTVTFGPALTVAVTAEDATGASGSAAFGWIVHNLVTVTNPGTQTSATGTAVNVPIHASDSQAGQTLSYAAAGLPPGLSIDPATGLIAGTPSAPGGFSVTVTTQDQSGSSGSAHFAWIVHNLVTVTNPGTQTSVLGRAVNVPIHASDSDGGQPLSYAAAGLPPGLSINPATGLISGTIPASTPLLPPATVTVTAQDTTGTSGSTAFRWQLTELAE